MRSFLALCLCLALPACGKAGRLLISLERPAVKAFDPMSDVRLSRFNLRVIRGAGQSDQETLRTEALILQLGDVPVDEPFDLRLAGKSATGQMLGLGLVFDLEVPAEGDLNVAVKFRKPLGFVAGNHGIEQLDTTGTRTGAIRVAQPIAAPNAADVAVSPDGAWIASVSGNTLSAFQTSDTTKAWVDPVTLPAPGTCIGVSPDSTHVVVGHANGHVSIVNMDKQAEKIPDLRDVDVGGRPTRIVFGAERTLAHVLVDGSGYTEGCGTTARMVELDVPGATIRRSVSLTRPVSDLVLDPRDGRVLLAMPCDGRLGRLNGDTVEDTRVKMPSGAYDLALTDQYIVVFGTTQDSGLVGEAVLVDLNKQGYSDQRKPFALPGLAIWSTGQGGGALGLLLDLQSFTIYDQTVAPDGQRALVSFRATYASDNSFSGCQYQITMNVHGLMLVDLTVDGVVYWQMANLQFDTCSTCSYPTKFACDAWVRGALKQSGALSATEYTPRGSATLFGGS